MPRHSIAIRALALMLVSSGLGCESPAGPDEVIAEYALVTLSSHALPTTPSGGAGPLILADTVRLRADGTGERTAYSASGASGVETISRDAFTWRADGGLLEISFPCDDTVLASCIAPPHLAGELLLPGMQWLVPRARIYGDAPALYQRVGVR